jgi:hypothetical protein
MTSFAQGTESIDNYADVIDSREIIARIEYLESIVADETEGIELDEDEERELAALRAFAEDASGAEDWEYGETFIRDSYFVDYAQELAEDIGVPEVDRWPTRHIDWEAAADELKGDYTSYDFDGVTYWAR